MSKKILICIIVLIISIILLFAILLLFKSQNNDEKVVEKIENNTINEKKVGIFEITDGKKLYNLEAIINYYIDDVNISAEESLEDNSNTDTKDIEILKQLGMEIDRQLFIKRGYVLETYNKNILYFIEGVLIPKNLNEIDQNKRDKKDVTLTVILDNENKTFEISPYGTEFSNIIHYQKNILNSQIDEENLNKINKSIENKFYNDYIEEEISDEEIAERYYEDYQRNAIYYPEDAYEMIDEEYKNIRFPTFESYKEYLNTFGNKIEESILVQYAVNQMEGYIQYSLVDTAQNSYFIKSTTSPFDYKILLDNYTVKTQGFEEKYYKLSDEQKVATNAHIFLQMLNTGDYEHAYKLLADSFKNNNFRTFEEFKNYVINNMLSMNIEVNSKIDRQGNNFIYEIELRDSDSKAANTQKMTIIMQLKEGTDFVMSFSIE